MLCALRLHTCSYGAVSNPVFTTHSLLSCAPVCFLFLLRNSQSAITSKSERKVLDKPVQHQVCRPNIRFQHKQSETGQHSTQIFEEFFKVHQKGRLSSPHPCTAIFTDALPLLSAQFPHSMTPISFLSCLCHGASAEASRSLPDEVQVLFKSLWCGAVPAQCVAICFLCQILHHFSVA